MAKSKMAMAGLPGAFDGDQPGTVEELEALKASPTEAWPEGTWVETAHGGERYWDGEEWQQGKAPAPEQAPNEPEPEPDAAPNDIAATAAHQRSTRDY